MPEHTEQPERTALELAIEAAQTPLEKADALNALAWELRNTNTHRSQSLADEVLQIFARQVYSDEQKQRWLLQKARALVMLSVYNGRTENFRLSLAQAQEALAIYEQSGDKNGLAVTSNQIGAINFQLADMAKALDFFHKSLALYEELGDQRGQVLSLNNIGNAYIRLADYEQAVTYFQNSLPIAEAIGDQYGQALSHHSIGNVYLEMADYEQAMTHLMKGLAIAETLGDLHFQAASHHNIGNIYMALADFESAVKHYKKSIALAETIGNLHFQAAAYHSFGKIYYELADYDKALLNLTNSHNLFEEIGDQHGQVHSYFTFGQIFIKLRRFDEAETHLQKALALCEDLGLKKERYNVLEHLARLYSETGDFAQAYAVHRQFHIAKEEVFNQEQQQKLTRLQIVHETEQAKKEASLLRLKNEELANALAEIHRLKELVTICAWTGKVKMDDKWVRVEDYLQHTFGISVSHGISDEAREAIKKEMQKDKAE